MDCAPSMYQYQFKTELLMHLSFACFLSLILYVLRRGVKGQLRVKKTTTPAPPILLLHHYQKGNATSFILNDSFFSEIYHKPPGRKAGKCNSPHKKCFQPGLRYYSNVYCKNNCQNFCSTDVKSLAVLAMLRCGRQRNFYCSTRVW